MRRMTGVAANLDASLEQRYRSRGLAQATNKDEVPLSEALRMLVRERMTGMAPPPAARAMVDLWRNDFDQDVLRDLDLLNQCCRDQGEYARAMRRLLAHLDLDASLDEEPLSDDEVDDQSDNPDDSPDQQQGEGGESEAADASGVIEGDQGDLGDADGADEQGVEADGEMMSGGGEEDPGRPGRPPRFDERGNLSDG